jgi:CDP-glucose 4,6-dehydratase
MQAFDGIYLGRRVLITGHSGFKGGWLGLWLRELGAQVFGYGKTAPTRPSLHEVLASHVFHRETTADICDIDALRRSFTQAQPEIIFHLAAQPLVRSSYKNPLDTLQTNVMGTANVLDVIRQLNLRTTLVVVTTDKCYENQAWEHAYRENDPLGGHDVYSASKAAAEVVTHAWRRSFFDTNPRLGPVASARAGNVIGGGDYAEDRIIPDVVRAHLHGKNLSVRFPDATRPWQHVMDCLSGYLWLAACAFQQPSQQSFRDAFNFGPGPEAHRSVGALLAELHRHLPGPWYSLCAPPNEVPTGPSSKSDSSATQPTPSSAIAKSAPTSFTPANPSTVSNPHEARHLNLSIDRAVARLRWRPTWRFEQAVRETALWYKARHQDTGANILAFSIDQLTRFHSDALQQRIPWAGTLEASVAVPRELSAPSTLPPTDS